MVRFGLIGYPIGHSSSPKLFSKACGGRFEYDLIETPDFDRAWRTFIEGPYRAVNVTAPFKALAAAAADIRSAEVERTGAANILIKTPDGVKAHNSDYLGVKAILSHLTGQSVAVIGTGGAGRAARAAAEDLGLTVRSYHHDEIKDGVCADIIIYTLPCAVPGIELLDAPVLMEANYRDPVLSGHAGYIPGTVWHKAQADEGYPLMLGR